MSKKVEWVAPKDSETKKDLEPWMVQEAASQSRVNESNFQLSRGFIEDCRVVGTAWLGQGVPSGQVGFYAAELADALAECIEHLVRAGDVQLARRLPAVVERLTDVQKRYGAKVSARFVSRNTIETLLKKHAAKELLARAFAYEPDLERVMHWLGWKAVRAMPELELRTLLMRAMTKEELRTLRMHPLALLIVPELRALLRRERSDERNKNPEPHPLAAFIVRIFDLGERNFERPNINLFVEWLWQGRLWSGSGKTFEKCPWFGEAEKPLRSDTRTWMKRIREFLRKKTGGDTSKIIVFRGLLARREAKYAKGGKDAVNRLKDDKPEYALGVVMDEIEEAWKTMANRESGKKRKAKVAR